MLRSARKRAVDCRSGAAAQPGLRLAPVSRRGKSASPVPASRWRRRLGACRSPVSRLFSGGVGRCADSVLIAAGDRDTCESDLELSRVTALKGRRDATPPARRRSCRASGFGGRRDAERAAAPRSRKAGAAIPRGEFGLCDPRCPTARPAHQCAWHLSSTRIRTRRDTVRERAATAFPACGAAPAGEPARPAAA